MVVVEEFFVREEDEDEDEGGVASRRVSRLGGSVRFVRFGFYRFGSVSIGSVLGCLGDAFVLCIVY